MQITGTGIELTGGFEYTYFFVPPTDPYFNYVSMLLPGTGTNNASNNTFIDSSTNNFTVTRNGTATQGSFSPYNAAWSNYFDGSGDYLTIPDNVAFNFGSGNFTIEGWFYIQNIGSSPWLISQWETVSGSDTNSSWQIGTEANKFIASIAYNNSISQFKLTGTTTISNGLWYHVSLVRNGTAHTLYVNGFSEATSTAAGTSTLNDSNLPVTIGQRYNGSLSYKGFVSNIRIVKGVALYTSSFTPPTSSLTAITDTVLLTCQSNRFVDNSTNNFTITNAGEVYTTAFNPFNPTSVYNASTTGGSLNLNGSTDFLSLAGSSQFAIATSTTPFTIEAWIYPLVAGGVIFSEGFTGSSDTVAIALSLTNGTGVDIVTGLIVGFGWYNGTTWTTAALANSAVPLNAWTHVAAVFTGSTTKIYYNGVDVTKTSSPTPSTTWGITGDNGDIWYVGRRWDTNSPAYFYGYISDFRFVNGTAVYTGNFSVPTAPLTAITNTKLLLNNTNAAIIDNTAINDVTAFSTAAISTVQSKFGNGSIYLNGSSYLRSQWTPSYYMGATFTIELWAYLTVTPSGGALISEYFDGSADIRVVYNIGFGSSMGATTGSNIYFGCYNGSWSGVTTSTSLTLNTWNHVAVVSSSSTVTIYINGSSVGSGSVTLPTVSGTYLHVGKRWDNAGGSTPYVTGYINDLRITNGIARYTENFAPPTEPFPLNG